MAYLRTKTVKNNDYCYLVKSKWEKEKGGRQKVKKYLGRVYTFDIKEEKGFFDLFDKDYSDTKDIIKDVIRWELKIRGFKEEDGVVSKDDIRVYLDDLSIDFKGKEKGAIKLNQGFLCNYTLNKLVNFKRKGENDDYRLAKAFVEAGLRIPKELFVEYWEKIIK